jgi:hypothetical protein
MCLLALQICCCGCCCCTLAAGHRRIHFGTEKRLHKRVTERVFPQQQLLSIYTYTTGRPLLAALTQCSNPAMLHHAGQLD